MDAEPEVIDVEPEPVPEPVREASPSRPEWVVYRHDGEAYKEADGNTIFVDAYETMIQVYGKKMDKEKTDPAEAVAMLYQIRDRNNATVKKLQATDRVRVVSVLNTLISKWEGA